MNDGRGAALGRRPRAARGLIRPAGVALSFLPWLVLLGWLSSIAWFLCDDAFISFRYARNLLEGHGLVFNPGEYVEGYTNFLWVLELAALWGGLGIPPERAAPWLSVVCTVGVVAVLGVWLARLPLLRHRWLVAWMAFGLLCSSATFAVWTSGGGLETRQFTLFIVGAVVCLSLWRSERWGLAAAALSLALAAWTRPEGLLTGLVCIGWFAGQSMADAGRPRPDWRRLAWLAAPFVVLVAAHYLFRYAYYGEWLPNTYYAKHVRPWYESGFRYLWAAALETGLYLLLPLAAVAARERWRAYRDGAFALPLLLMGVHMFYVMRIGGDHFEYRPLDFYWPLLAFPAAVGIVHLGSCLAAGRWRSRLPGLGGMGARACAVAVFVPVLFYAGAIQGALLFEGAAVRDWLERVSQRHAWYVELDRDNAGWLLAAPGMPMLVAISNDLRRQAVWQSAAVPFFRHRNAAASRLRRYKAYEHMERGLIPADGLMDSTYKAYEHMERGLIPADGLKDSRGIGIRFYYLPDLKVIDKNGLTDATVARNPVTRANHERIMAHDRRPPPGYLEERGVNVTVHPAADNPTKALMRGRYTVRVGPNLWMPFDSPDEEWVLDRFAGRSLHVRDVRDAGLSWEQAAPDFDFRSGDLGFVMDRSIHMRPRVQAFARDCTPDELLVWPWPNEKVDTPAKHQRWRINETWCSRVGWVCFRYPPAPQHWTINETGLCRATTATPWEWTRSVVDDPSRLEEVERVRPALRSVFDVYRLRTRLLYFRQPCRPDDTDAKFFLHLIPVDDSDLSGHRRQYGFDNLDFDFRRRGLLAGGMCLAEVRLPGYPIVKIRTGQFTGEGRLWEGAIVVTGPGGEGSPPP